MTRKDYETLARALRDAHPATMPGGDDTPAARNAWQACVQFVADVLAADNPRFSRPTFYAAAKPERAP